MWSRIFAGYLKRIYKVVLWFLFTEMCFAVILYLYHVQASATSYAVLLSAVAGIVLLLADFRGYALRCRRLEQLLDEGEPEIEQLPPAHDRLEEDYRALVQKIDCRRQAEEQRSVQAQQDLVDYYTLWVHQIKTPIAALRLLLQTDAGKNVGTMSMELFQIEQYADMVLQYLRLGSTTNDFVIQSCDLDDVVRQALRKYARMFIGRKISLEFRETGMRVLTDEKWLLFVIGQLLSNALKYTDQGKVRIYAEERSSIVIEDTGIGISAEDLPRIFEKGYTGFNGRMDKKATGLGLYLCKQVCDKLSHQIAVTAVPGAGTRVTLTFPSSSPK